MSLWPFRDDGKPLFGRGWGGFYKIMKKKQYITPEVEIAEIELVDMIATSLGVSDEETDEDAWMSNRRGTWGNLWAVED